MLALTAPVCADACFLPFMGGGAQRARSQAMAAAMQRHNFAIERDTTLTRAKLIVPRRMLPPAVRSAAADTIPAGMALACGCVCGGLWLARVRRRVLLGVTVPLLLLVLTAVVWANAPPPFGSLNVQVPRVEGQDRLFAGEVDVYIDLDADHVRLILPAKK
jgi:hypothetical protein